MGLLDDAIREHLELKRRHGADNSEVARQEREILGGSSSSSSSAGATAPAESAETPDFEAPAEVAHDGLPAGEVTDIADDIAAAEPVQESDALTASELLAGSPLASGAGEPDDHAQVSGDLFPATSELVAAGSEPAAPVRPEPAPSDADSETVARSGARRLSDDELAAWRRRLSERADKLAAQRTADAQGSTAPPTPAQPEQSADAGKPGSFWAASSGDAAGEQQPGVPRDFFDAGDAESAFAPEPAPEPEASTDHDVLDETPDFLEETPEHDRMWFEQKPPRDFDFG